MRFEICFLSNISIIFTILCNCSKFIPLSFIISIPFDKDGYFLYSSISFSDFEFKNLFSFEKQIFFSFFSFSKLKIPFLIKLF
jgi:hypothetical protein